MTMERTRTSEEARREFIRDLLAVKATVTIQEAWEVGHIRGHYEGGDAQLVKADLNAVGRRHPGYVRAITEDERRRAVRWADYWTRRGSRS